MFIESRCLYQFVLGCYATNMFIFFLKKPRKMAAALKKFRLLEKQTDEVQQPAAPASKTQVIKLLFFSVFIFNLESDYFSYINEKYFKITLKGFR